MSSLAAACLVVAGTLFSIAWAGWALRRRRALALTSMYVLGSGGHTAEMLQLLRGMLPSPDHSASRVYVVAKTDALSAKKAEALEATLNAGGDGEGDGGENSDENSGENSDDDGDGPLPYKIELVDRAREVGQSYLTSFFTTLRSFLTTARLVLRHRPGMVLVNGPGTCLPIVVWARVLVPGSRVYYVESIARVDHLSLTGKILLKCGLANGGFYVQWRALAEALRDRGHADVAYAGRVY
jgi:beta-1,4-N-acetylglucosaminyltransferase